MSIDLGMPSGTADVPRLDDDAATDPTIDPTGDPVVVKGGHA